MSESPSALGFGETMVRLSTENYTKFEQANKLDLGIGGTESNFAIAFQRLGGNSAWISKLTDNFLGRFVVNRVRKHGVDVSDVIWTDDHRVGVYYIELGRKPRPAKVVYDREDSAISNVSPGEVNWEVLESKDLLFTTGITPALSRGCRETVVKAIRKAGRVGTKIFFDLNYRSKLWTPEEAFETLSPLLENGNVDILTITEREALNVLKAEGDYKDILRQLHDRYEPEVLILTLGSEGAAALRDGEISRVKPYELEAVDRIGAGDAHNAAFAYQYLMSGNVERALEWGMAAAAYAHTVPGDVVYFEREEIESIVDEKTPSGDVER